MIETLCSEWKGQGCARLCHLLRPEREPGAVAAVAARRRRTLLLLPAEPGQAPGSGFDFCFNTLFLCPVRGVLCVTGGHNCHGVVVDEQECREHDAALNECVAEYDDRGPWQCLIQDSVMNPL